MGTEIFARRFFSQLYCRLQAPFTLVFDNYDKISGHSTLHAILCQAQQTLPEGITIVVTSRQPPPPALAKVRASQHFYWIDGNALCLTREEAHHIAQIHSKQQLGQARLDNIHSLSRGWMAGLILMANTKKPPEDTPQTGGSTQALFDYFAEEVWRHVKPETRQILQQLALLPFVSESCAIRLTGVPNAGKALENLADGYFFTYRHEEEKGTYRFHPLFREYLLEQTQKNLSASVLSSLKQKAAGLLEAEEYFEAAFDLYLSSGKLSEAARLGPCLGVVSHPGGEQRRSGQGG